MACLQQVDVVNTRFCLPTSAVSKENFFNLGRSQIKSFNLDGRNRKQSTIASSQSGLLFDHIGHKYVLCQVWPVQYCRPLGFGHYQACDKTEAPKHMCNCSALNRGLQIQQLHQHLIAPADFCLQHDTLRLTRSSPFHRHTRPRRCPEHYSHSTCSSLSPGRLCGRQGLLLPGPLEQHPR